MLIFIDQPKQIRVVRTGNHEGETSRAPVGRVMKNTYELTTDLKAALSTEETLEVEQALEAYRQADAVKQRYFALQFPSIARETMDYFEEHASETERHLIMGALMESVRRMRKFGRVASAA